MHKIPELFNLLWHYHLTVLNLNLRTSVLNISFKKEEENHKNKGIRYANKVICTMQEFNFD